MKIKKSLYSICLALILVLSTFVLFACGGGGKAVDVYTEYNTLLTEFEKDTSLFSKNTIGEMQTNYYLNDFYEKNEYGSTIQTYFYYNILSSISMNFIEQYYSNFENLDVKANYNQLVKDAQNLKDRYQELKTEHDNLKNASADVNYVIYNGYFSRYRLESQEFINQAYTCAVGIADVLAEAGLTEQLDYYVDYNILQNINFYQEFALGSAKGVRLDNDVFQNIISDLSVLTYNVIGKNVKSLSAEEIQALQKIVGNTAYQREMADKSLKEFSFYDYVNAYESSILAYSKVKANAGAYYNMIDETQRVLNNFTQYLVVNVVA